MQKTSSLALLGKKIPEKLSGLSVKGRGGVPPLSAKGFLAKWFSVKGVGGGYPLNGQNPLKRFWWVPLLGPDHFFSWNDWISYREPNILFVPLFCTPNFSTFRIAETLLPNLKFPLISWNRISTVLQSDLTKTAAYQTQSSMVHKKHIWYLHPNPGYIKSITL